MDHDKETRKGADACMAALLDMSSVAEMANNPDGWTWQQHWRTQQATFDILLKASGVESPYLKGFISTLAEFVNLTHTSGEPNLDAGGWKPLASMTDQEVATYRKKAEARFNSV